MYVYIYLYAYLNIKNNSINIKNAYHALMIWYLCGNSMPILTKNSLKKKKNFQISFQYLENDPLSVLKPIVDRSDG